ncbi:uncharacterized protein LOC143202059 [Rhynchophorus ferrugineus]|uniref:uncharacterized protein LOC143202059 n=1 Tax=Rhynchophorus ferrugineus TaxID=354439 RepID=UPI003FCEA9EB
MKSPIKPSRSSSSTSVHFNMLPKYAVLLVALAASSLIVAKQIPVEIRYERLEHNLNDNLAEKPQLSQEQLKENDLRLKSSFAEELNEEPKDYVKNLDAKVQLSPDQLLQAYKHIPIHHSIQEGDDKEDNLVSLNELRDAGSLRTDTPSLKSLAEKVIEEGLENLRNSFKSSDNEATPSKELWDKLEGEAKDLVQNTEEDGTSRQEGGGQQNFLQSISSGFQNLTSNFIQNFRPASTQNGSSADEGQSQGPIQGFVGFFTGGVQNIVSNIQNLGQNNQPASSNSTVLGDSTTAQPGVIGNIVTNVQHFFQGPGSSNASGTPNQGFFVGAISQINQAVSNIIPTTPASTQGDQGTQQGGPIQQVFQNIGNAFNQFIGQNRTQAPNKNPTTASAAPVTEAASASAPVSEAAAAEEPAPAAAARK